MRPWLLLTVLAIGCSRPSPPTLKPESGKVTAITPAGITVLVTVEATNPNGVDLTAKSVTANVVLEGKYPLGTATISHTVTLPANKATRIEAPITATFANLAALVPLAAGSAGSIAYALDGTVGVGAGSISFNVPFHLDGTVSKADLMKAALQSVPALPLRAP